MATVMYGDLSEAIDGMHSDLLFANKVIAMPEFTSFLVAEKELIMAMQPFLDDVHFPLPYAMGVLGKVANRFITFKATDWEAGKNFKPKDLVK